MTKISFISDLHMTHSFNRLPGSGDILIIGGDSICTNSLPRFNQFVHWLDFLDFKHKILIAGNHDEILTRENRHVCLQILRDKNIHYLEDNGLEINGIKIYGTPWTSVFFDWFFMLETEELKKKWDYIPNDTDILITHMPPANFFAEDFGCPYLLEKVLKSNIKMHLFGHNHCFGHEIFNGKHFFNGAVVNNRNKPFNSCHNFNWG